MRLSLFTHRSVLVPTLLGWLLLLVLVLAAPCAWLLWGESFLSPNDPAESGTLVVEGWIGRDGLRAAAALAKGPRYSKVVTVGLTEENTQDGRRWNFAEIAAKELRSHGVPSEKIESIVVPYTDHDRTRTFAKEVKRFLERQALVDGPLTVFTLASHGRRSRLIYSRVFSERTTVHVVSWSPAREQSRRWWESSARAREFIVETAGWPYELIFGGRK